MLIPLKAPSPDKLLPLLHPMDQTEMYTGDK